MGARQIHGRIGIYNSSPTTNPGNMVDGEGSALLVDQQQRAVVVLGSLLAGENLTQNVIHVEEEMRGINIAASTAVQSQACRLCGIFVSAASATPTIKVWNNTAASGTVMVDTFTPVAATMYNFGGFIAMSVGCFVTIGGTVSCTVFTQV